MRVEFKRIIAGGLLMSFGLILWGQATAQASRNPLDFARSFVGQPDRPAPNLAAFPWPDTLAFGFFLGGLGLVLSTVKRAGAGRRAAAAAGAWEEGLYVGEVRVNASKLGAQAVLELVFVAFNALDHAVSLEVIEGSIRYASVRNGTHSSDGVLPVPAFRPGDALDRLIPDRSEFGFALTQTVPKDSARELAALLAEGGEIYLDLTGLNVMVVPEGRREMARLPLWEGVRLKQAPHFIESKRAVVRPRDRQAALPA